MTESTTKREIPTGLKKLLELDVKLSKEFVEAVNKKYPIDTIRSHLKSLEVSCHGIPWLVLTIAGLYLTNSSIFINILLGLIIDIVIVAITKAFTRRRRPAYNVDDQHATFKSVDKFSFPSGHATRAIMLAVLFTFLSPLPALLWIPVIVWSLAVSVSRVVLGRHHILDVVAGVVIGLLESVILSMLWRNEEQASFIMSMFGGEDPWSSA
eukprot:TRINITY_DN41863_c0_g1_i1.p1 TRINITY_DN41863_c0_g1~~TRINITY_DN41863_c0_g1_i1.p1  ORF type:complete len:210 (-),score=59.33 TRINITY_DN41863_c0_g1_i1:196-825(-)